MWCPICKKKGVWNELDKIIQDPWIGNYKCDECKTHFDNNLQVVKRGENDCSKK